MKNLNITKMMQVKFNQMIGMNKSIFSLPVQKFVKEMTYGIINSQSCIVRKIAQKLEQNISLKKIQERLSYHLDNSTIETTLKDYMINSQAKKLAQNSLIIIDPSDIVKEYAEKSEGLCKVHDASKNTTNNGYQLLDIIGLNRTEESSEIIPLASEVCSSTMDLDTLNNKLTYLLEDLIIASDNRCVMVFDRGFDHKKMYKFHSDNESAFIIRGKKNRNLIIDSRVKNIHEIAKKVKLEYLYKDGKRHLRGGVIRVKIPVDPHLKKKNPTLVDALLVVGHISSAKNKKGGLFYFLCGNLDDRFKTKKELLSFVLRSYKARWKIEEVHRQIKEDFDWEEIKLQKYQRIKTMNILLWYAICFVYGMKRYQNLFIREVPNLILDKKKINEIPKFIYYRIALIVTTFFKQFSIRRKQPTFLNLEFEQLSAIC